MLRGRVHSDGLPVAGAEIVEKQGSTQWVRGETDENGGYEIDLLSLGEDKQAVAVLIRKEGFRDTTRLVKRSDGAACGVSFLSVALTRTGDASISGFTVYVLPIKIYAAGPTLADESVLNERFTNALAWRINSYLSALEVRPPFSDVSVKADTQSIRLGDAEGIRARGSALNALAMVAGEVDAPVATEDMRLTALFRVIPTAPGFNERLIEIEETIPSGHFSPRSLAGALKNVWGQKVLVAYAVKELSDVAALDKDERLRRVKPVQNLLIAARSKMAVNDVLLDEFNALIERTDKEEPL